MWHLYLFIQRFTKVRMRPKRPAALLLFAFLCAPALAATPKADPAITVQPQGLRIAKPVPSNEDHKSDPLRPFNAFTGTSVSLLVQSPKGGIIAIEQEKCEVSGMTDDKGTDLSKPAEKESFQSGVKFWPFANISPDGKYCQLELQAPGVPAAGATKVLAKGKIVLMTATVKKEFTAANVALKPGTVIRAGAIPLTIKSAGKPQWGDMPLQVSLEASQELTDIQSIEFFDAAGKKIESTSGGGGSMRFGGIVTITRDYQLKEKVDLAKVVVTYWMDAKTVSVPLDFKIGVGF